MMTMTTATGNLCCNECGNEIRRGDDVWIGDWNTFNCSPRCCHRSNIREDRCPRCGKPGGRIERYSLGIYAGRMCDECWDKSGYRKEGREGFNPLDAGEAYEAEDY